MIRSVKSAAKMFAGAHKAVAQSTDHTGQRTVTGILILNKSDASSI